MSQKLQLLSSSLHELSQGLSSVFGLYRAVCACKSRVGHISHELPCLHISHPRTPRLLGQRNERGGSVLESVVRKRRESRGGLYN